MNILFLPRFSSQNILLLLFVIFKYIVDRINCLHVVFQFPRLFGYNFLGISRRRRHSKEKSKQNGVHKFTKNVCLHDQDRLQSILPYIEKKIENSTNYFFVFPHITDRKKFHSNSQILGLD